MEKPKKLKQGDRREDGMVFVAYMAHCTNGEYWITQDKFIKYRERSLASAAKWRKRNLKRARQLYKESYQRIRIKKLEYCKKRRAENLEMFLSRERAFKDRHRDRLRKIDRDRRRASPEKSRQYTREWNKRHPEMKSISEAKRRAAKAGTEVNLCPDQKLIIKTLYLLRKRITKCLGILHHVDHIIPLSKGGHHAPSNMQILPEKINCSKHNKLPHEFPIP